MKRGLILAGLVVLTGCTTPTPGSESVVMTANSDQVRGCTLLRQVDADQMMLAGAPGRNDVRQQLRNAAVEAGATHVFMTVQPDVTASWASGSGELYRCRT